MHIIIGVLGSIVHDVLARGGESFSDAQRTSALDMLERVADASGTASAQQRELITRVRAQLAPEPAPKGTWT